MLKTVLETMDGVDDAIKSLYAEKDGAFVLNLDGIDQHPEVKNLKSAFESVKAKNSTLAEERDALKAKASSLPEDFDADEWAKRGEKPDLDAEAQAKLVKLRKELENERDAAKAETQAIKTEFETKLTRFAIERDLGTALSKVGITDPALAQGATAMLASVIRTDESGNGIVETDMGPVPLHDHVAKWAAGDGKAFVTPPKGGDRSGSETKSKNSNPLLDKVPALADLPEK